MPSITTNQVMGDGIMALFGAPLAHEDHAVRACYAALLWHSSARTGGQVQRRIFLRRAWRGLCVTSSVEHDLRCGAWRIGRALLTHWILLCLGFIAARAWWTGPRKSST